MVKFYRKLSVLNFVKNIDVYRKLSELNFVKNG